MRENLPEINPNPLYTKSIAMKPLSNYTPKLCKTRSWEDIEHSFENCFAGQNKNNILQLVKHIRKTGMENRLYGLTSMNKLVIGLYEIIEWDRETLHITFDVDKSEWHFVYYSAPYYQPKFVRNYPLDKGIEKFDNFIKMIKW